MGRKESEEVRIGSKFSGGTPTLTIRSLNPSLHTLNTKIEVARLDPGTERRDSEKRTDD